MSCNPADRPAISPQRQELFHVYPSRMTTNVFALLLGPLNTGANPVVVFLRVHQKLVSHALPRRPSPALSAVAGGGLEPPTSGL